MPLIKKEIDKIVKDLKLTLAALSCYDILLGLKEFKSLDEKLTYYMQFKEELNKLITLEIYNKLPEETIDVLRHYFKLYAEYDNLFIEGLKFFCNFAEFLKIQKFNSIKAFVFYFAYQTKKYNFPGVKELLGQELLNASINNGKVYLEFCMYCFYKGLYYIEKRNFFMASYLYTIPVSMGLRGNSEDCKILNNFSVQMIKSLCFLKPLSEFDIKAFLIKESRMYHYNDILTIKHEDINSCLNYIINESSNIQNFNTFVKSNKEFANNNKLKGLKKEAEEALIFKRLKECLSLYKKIKMTKLAQKTQIEFKDLMRVVKIKVLAGEINIKYDEAADVVEVFDVDPGLKERVEKTKELYKNIIEGNKNVFINLKDRRIKELSGGEKFSKEELDFINMRQVQEFEGEEEYMGMGMEMGMDED